MDLVKLPMKRVMLTSAPLVWKHLASLSLAHKDSSMPGSPAKYSSPESRSKPGNTEWNKGSVAALRQAKLAAVVSWTSWNRSSDPQGPRQALQANTIKSWCGQRPLRFKANLLSLWAAWLAQKVGSKLTQAYLVKKLMAAVLSLPWSGQMVHDGQVLASTGRRAKSDSCDNDTHPSSPADLSWLFVARSHSKVFLRLSFGAEGGT